MPGSVLPTIKRLASRAISARRDYLLVHQELSLLLTADFPNEDHFIRAGGPTAVHGAAFA
jgi:hypothetical protein